MVPSKDLSGKRILRYIRRTVLLFHGIIKSVRSRFINQMVFIIFSLILFWNFVIDRIILG